MKLGDLRCCRRGFLGRQQGKTSDFSSVLQKPEFTCTSRTTGGFWFRTHLPPCFAYLFLLLFPSHCNDCEKMRTQHLPVVQGSLSLPLAIRVPLAVTAKALHAGPCLGLAGPQSSETPFTNNQGGQIIPSLPFSVFLTFYPKMHTASLLLQRTGLFSRIFTSFVHPPPVRDLKSRHAFLPLLPSSEHHAVCFTARHFQKLSECNCQSNTPSNEVCHQKPAMFCFLSFTY